MPHWYHAYNKIRVPDVPDNGQTIWIISDLLIITRRSFRQQLLNAVKKGGSDLINNGVGRSQCSGCAIGRLGPVQTPSNLIQACDAAIPSR